MTPRFRRERCLWVTRPCEGRRGLRTVSHRVGSCQSPLPCRVPVSLDTQPRRVRPPSSLPSPDRGTRTVEQVVEVEGEVPRDLVVPIPQFVDGQDPSVGHSPRPLRPLVPSLPSLPFTAPSPNCSLCLLFLHCGSVVCTCTRVCVFVCVVVSLFLLPHPFSLPLPPSSLPSTFYSSRVPPPSLSLAISLLFSYLSTFS